MKQCGGSLERSWRCQPLGFDVVREYLGRQTHIQPSRTAIELASICQEIQLMMLAHNSGQIVEAGRKKNLVHTYLLGYRFKTDTAGKSWCDFIISPSPCQIGIFSFIMLQTSFIIRFLRVWFPWTNAIYQAKNINVGRNAFDVSTLLVSGCVFMLAPRMGQLPCNFFTGRIFLPTELHYLFLFFWLVWEMFSSAGIIVDPKVQHRKPRPAGCMSFRLILIKNLKAEP